jgi:hypothetical protein
MTTAIAQPGQSKLPLLALVGAGVAAALSVVAIVTDDVADVPAPAVVPVEDDQPRAFNGTQDSPSYNPYMPPTNLTDRDDDRTVGPVRTCDGPLNRYRPTVC